MEWSRSLINSELSSPALPVEQKSFVPSRPQAPSANRHFLKENVTAVTNIAEYLAPASVFRFENAKAGMARSFARDSRRSRLSRTDTGRSYMFGGLHPLGMPFALEFVRDLIGSVPARSQLAATVRS